VSQALALFVKVIKKISKRLTDIQKTAIGAELPLPPLEAGSSRVSDGIAEGGETGEGGKRGEKKGEAWKSVAAALEDELNEAGDEATRALREKQREMIDALDLRK